MKLMLYSWNANNEQILADNLIKMGFDIVWFRKKCTHYTRDMELAMEMIPLIHAQGIEAVVSFNYFPIISMICNTCKIPYYAWVYDCPHFTLYAKQIMLPYSHIGIFDRNMVRQLEGYGINTVYHVPLSVDSTYFNKAVIQASKQERERYRCDISFVGSLYTGEYNYYDMLFPAGREDRSEPMEQSGPTDHSELVDAAMDQQCFSYGEDCLRQAVMDGSIDISTLQTQMERAGLMLGEDYFARPEDILLAAVLEKKVTVEERKTLLTEIVRQFSDNYGNGNNIVKQRATGKAEDTACVSGSSDSGPKAEKAYDFRLYTNSDTKKIAELDCCNHGAVDYHTQMPLVFAGSRINLNISLRSIHSGIPLRVLDIMACGGFVLSNWQPEIAENFEEGTEIVTFDSLDDSLHKIEYYLTHEEERRRIAENGQRKVQERFSYQIGLEKLFR